MITPTPEGTKICKEAALLHAEMLAGCEYHSIEAAQKAEAALILLLREHGLIALDVEVVDAAFDGTEEGHILYLLLKPHDHPARPARWWTLNCY